MTNPKSPIPETARTVSVPEPLATPIGWLNLGSTELTVTKLKGMFGLQQGAVSIDDMSRAIATGGSSAKRRET